MPWFGGQRKDAEEVQPKTQDSTAEVVSVKEATPMKPTQVRLPRASIQAPSVSYTADDSADQGSKNLWQVYALGGFMILRWVWARWKERRDARDAADDEDD